MDIVSTLVSVTLTAAIVIPLIVVIVLVRQLLTIARASRDGRVGPAPSEVADDDEDTPDAG